VDAATPCSISWLSHPCFRLRLAVPLVARKHRSFLEIGPHREKRRLSLRPMSSALPRTPRSPRTKELEEGLKVVPAARSYSRSRSTYRSRYRPLEPVSSALTASLATASTDLTSRPLRQRYQNHPHRGMDPRRRLAQSSSSSPPIPLSFLRQPLLHVCRSSAPVSSSLSAPSRNTTRTRNTIPRVPPPCSAQR
jgi:hypothetical protein